MLWKLDEQIPPFAGALVVFAMAAFARDLVAYRGADTVGGFSLRLWLSSPRFLWSLMQLNLLLAQTHPRLRRR